MDPKSKGDRHHQSTTDQDQSSVWKLNFCIISANETSPVIGAVSQYNQSILAGPPPSGLGFGFWRFLIFDTISDGTSWNVGKLLLARGTDKENNEIQKNIQLQQR